MKAQNSPKISVVIPCYNEQNNIKSCLKAVLAQDKAVYEVIVVNNNSTDDTAKIVGKFKGVRLINESKQGLISARNKGMNTAKGDIIARIDADTIVSKSWSKTLLLMFSDESIQAVTGTGYFYDAPFKHLYQGLRNLIAVHINRVILGHHMLWGTNMALRATCWRAVRSEVCAESDIMEDLDVAIHVNQLYGKKSLLFSKELRADISARRAMTNLKQNYLYLRMWPKTLKMHGYILSPLLWPIVLITMIGGVPVSASLRLYNTDQQRLVFSRKQWQTSQLYDRPAP